MASNIVLEQVGPFTNEDDPDKIYYRACDFCFDSAVQDVFAGEEEWRTFYILHPDGLSVCEHCVAKIEMP